MRSYLKLFLMVALVTVVMAAATPSPAQVVLVDNQYYVTELRPGKNEFGVALKKGEYTKNWVHVKSDTRISMRRWLGQGRGFKDQVIPADRLFNVLRLGMKVRVAGGRNWDGSTNAKQIWF
jgi:hypothetical protein